MSPLKEPGWVAVRAMVERVRVHRVMDELFGARWAGDPGHRHPRVPAMSLAQTLEALVDPGSIEPIPVPMRPAKGDYLATLERARERSGVDESVQDAGPDQRLSGRRHRRRVRFPRRVGGTVRGRSGRGGYQAATADSLPVITLPTSGGTRMRETTAFFRMTDIAWATEEHLRTGAIRVGWLRNPTTGGVMATWGSYADITAAEPGTSRLPRSGVYEALHGEPFRRCRPRRTWPGSVIIDQVVALGELREWVSRNPRRRVRRRREEDEFGDHGVPEPVDAWEASRAPRRGPSWTAGRAGSHERPHRTARTGAGESGGGIRLALRRLRGVQTLVVAQTREEVSPAGLRVAQRGLRLADRVGLPVITLIDTPVVNCPVARGVGDGRRITGRCRQCRG